MKRVLYLLAVVMLLGAASVQAGFLTVDQYIYQSGTGVNPGLLSGAIFYESDGDTITILLTNTSPDAAFVGSPPSNMLLTGFGIQLPGVNIVSLGSGTVTVPGTSTALNFDPGQSTTDITNQWAYANQSIAGYNLTGALAVDTVVTSVNNGQSYNISTGAKPPGIDGPDYGALSANETEFGNSQPGVQNAIQFVLNLNGTAPSAADVDAGNVVLAFGSPNAVPDGGSTAMLLGFALAGLAVLVRKLD
jgi:hypothetical protein